MLERPFDPFFGGIVIRIPPTISVSIIVSERAHIDGRVAMNQAIEFAQAFGTPRAIASGG